MMNRKMKQLALAVGVALGSAGLLPSAQAVNVSPDNLGQALIFPYYTVRSGWNTLIGVTNTTNQYVAVMVRFREAYNSRDVFDFNIILSPHDLWAATVVNGAGNNPQLAIPADETTCTVGLNSNPQPFPEPTSYVGSYNDGGPETVERLRSGYVEMIMMGATAGGEGTLPSAYDTCAELSSLFRAASTTPAAALTTLRDEIFTEYPANALKGTFSLVNGSKGFNAVSLPTALANFRTAPYITLHQAPSNAAAPNTISFSDSWHEPSLNSADNPGAYIGATGALYAAGGTEGAAAVTTALEAAALLNEWTRNPTGTGPAGTSFITATDWVVTFPTKNFYVDTATHEFAGRATAFGGRVDPALPATFPAPFTNTFADGESCDTVHPTVYNRSEVSAELEVPSPSGRFELCRETNVLTFNEGLILGNVADDAVVINYPTTFLYGWMNLGFDSSLPAIGFAVSSRDDGGGLLSEAAAYDHSVVRPAAAAPAAAAAAGN